MNYSLSDNNNKILLICPKCGSKYIRCRNDNDEQNIILKYNNINSYINEHEHENLINEINISFICVDCFAVFVLNLRYNTDDIIVQYIFPPLIQEP